jgi:capsular polysaccharide biosynthesis protein
MNEANERKYEDEVSLVDLALVLWEQKWVVTGVVILCTLLGIAYTFVKSDTYEYSTTIEIGTRLEGDEARPIEPPGTVASKLERNYIPEAIRTYEQELIANNGGQQLSLGVHVTQPEDTSLVVLTSRATEQLGDYYIRLHSRVVDRIAEDHRRASELEQVRIENRLEEAELRLEELTDERVLRVERKELENRITSAKNKLAQLSDQEELLKAELENLDVQEELIQKRLAELSEYIERARERRADTQSEVQGGAEGMALMLIDNDLQRDIDRQTELEQRLLVELPESRANLRSELEDSQRQQALQRKEITALEAQYEKLLIDQERRVPEAEASVREFETRLENLRETRPVLPPQRSLKTVGISGKLIVALSVVIGGVLGLFAAMLVGFVHRVRRRIARQ